MHGIVSEGGFTCLGLARLRLFERFVGSCLAVSVCAVEQLTGLSWN